MNDLNKLLIFDCIQEQKNNWVYQKKNCPIDLPECSFQYTNFISGKLSGELIREQQNVELEQARILEAFKSGK